MKTELGYKEEQKLHCFAEQRRLQQAKAFKTASWPQEGAGRFSREIEDLAGFYRNCVSAARLLPHVLWVVLGS